METDRLRTQAGTRALLIRKVSDLNMTLPSHWNLSIHLYIPKATWHLENSQSLADENVYVPLYNVENKHFIARVTSYDVFSCQPTMSTNNVFYCIIYKPLSAFIFQRQLPTGWLSALWKLYKVIKDIPQHLKSDGVWGAIWCLQSSTKHVNEPCIVLCDIHLY